MDNKDGLELNGGRLTTMQGKQFVQLVRQSQEFFVVREVPLVPWYKVIINKLLRWKLVRIDRINNES
jgi:hypothetical protein